MSRRRSYSLAQRTTSGSDARTLTMNARSVLRARLLNELSGNYSRNASDNLSELTDRFGVTPLDVWDLVPSFAPAASSSTVSLPGSVQDYTLGPAVANRQVQAQIVDTMSWNTRRHGYRFGVDARRLTPVVRSHQYRSAVTFNLLTSLLNNRADLLTISSSDPVRLGIINFSAFAQDTLRMTNRLTFDYGMRWEVNPPPTGLNLPLYTLTGFPDLTALRLAAPGTPLYPTRWGKVAPRVGVAYRFRQAGQQVTLARGSFGLFYDLGTGATTTAARMFPYNRSVRRVNVPFPPDERARRKRRRSAWSLPTQTRISRSLPLATTLPRTWSGRQASSSRSPAHNASPQPTRDMPDANYCGAISMRSSGASGQHCISRREAERHTQRCGWGVTRTITRCRSNTCGASRAASRRSPITRWRERPIQGPTMRRSTLRTMPRGRRFITGYHASIAATCSIRR